MLGRTNAVSGKPTQTKTVEFNPGSANSISIIPDDGYLLSSVEVGKPLTMIPENIKSGIDIGGVVGTFEGGVNTSDATATSNDILLGKTAYANNEKITGTIPTYNNEHENGYVQINTLKKLLDATKSTEYLFYQYSGTSVDGLISYNDTENVTNMSRMFYGAKVTAIPLLNTSNVTNMTYMFQQCSNLKTIPLIDTSNITDMEQMFQQCSSLTSIPLLNTSKVTRMYFAFYNCSNLTSIPALDVSKVTNTNSMFAGCSSLTAIHMIGMSVSFFISASTLFTTEALHEIIDNLATVSSTQTLTMGSTNLAKVSDEYKAIATNKGWTLA